MKEHKELNYKNVKQEIKDKGVFYTPPELVEYMKTLIDIPIKDVYDPTCGVGNLLAVFDDELPKFGQEINDHQLAIAEQKLKNFTGVCGDTLKDPAFMDRKFSCIMGNPPFGIAWEQMKDDERFNKAPALAPKSKSDYAFLLHIIDRLADDGIAVVLNSLGIGYRRNAEYKIRRYILENNWIDKVVFISGDKFVDTKIGTLCLVIKKNRKNTDVEFINYDTQESKIVSFDTIKENDFDLGEGRYFTPKFEEKVYDKRVFESPEVCVMRILEAEIERMELMFELKETLGEKITETFLGGLEKLENIIKKFREKHLKKK